VRHSKRKTFWSGGISNPLSVIEQFTYLLFPRRLDELHTAREAKANLLPVQLSCKTSFRHGLPRSASYWRGNKNSPEKAKKPLRRSSNAPSAGSYSRVIFAMPSNFDLLRPKWADRHADGRMVACRARSLASFWYTDGIPRRENHASDNGHR
jgi:hypothetical protein